jgi:sporulation protein YlmC with PRC-barrel domain
MKKMSVVLSVLVLGAMLLAACGGSTGGQSQTTPGAGTEAVGTPSGSLTTQPTTGTEAATTPSAEATGTLEAAGTPTTAAGTGAEATQTPTTAGGTGQIPQTGAGEQFVLLSTLLKANVQSKDGQQIGKVNGVLIDQFASTAGANVTTTEATPTTAANTGTTPTATVAAGNNSGMTGGMANRENPRISYVIVDVTGSGNAASGPVLAPFEAFDVSGSSSVGTTSNSGSMDTTPTKAVSNTENTTPAAATPTVAAGGTSNTTGGTTAMSGEVTLVLTVDAASLSGAPKFDEAAFKGMVGEDVSSYWSGKVTGFPAMGAVGAGTNAVAIRGQIGSLNVTGADDKVLGQVRDFVVDTQTGELVYAVLGGGSAFGSNMYVVPLSVMTWTAGKGQGANLGTFNTSVAADKFSSAPSITSVDEIHSDAAWFDTVNSYWNTGTSVQ